MKRKPEHPQESMQHKTQEQEVPTLAEASS